MKMTNTHKKILRILEKKSVDDSELSKLLNMKPSSMRARISELKTMNYNIIRKYTWIRD